MTIVCHACRKPFTFEPNGVPVSSNVRESSGSTVKVVTYYPNCTHCGVQCTYTRAEQ